MHNQITAVSDNDDEDEEDSAIVVDEINEIDY
jgi:hypothetical protein